jgi:hypothetical protein
MGFGKRIFELWKLRPYLAVAPLLACVVAVWSVANISLAPPRLTPRALEIATGTTHVVIDTPKSTILDLRQDTYSLEGLTQRAILLGNVMADGPVREEIARRAHVPVEALQIAAPLTNKEPRAQSGSASEKHASDILKSTDQYRLSIQANPTVPVLDIYSQAPNATSAAVLANAAVDGLRSYLADLATSEQTPDSDRIQLVQLGRAHGKVINNGIDIQTALLAFLLTLGMASATLIFFARVIRGWRMAELAERLTSN